MPPPGLARRRSPAAEDLLSRQASRVHHSFVRLAAARTWPGALPDDLRMNVLHLAAECAPFAKVGGLGDVLGALPAATAAHGVSPSLLMPLYGGVAGAVAAVADGLAPVACGETRYDGAPVAYTVHRARTGAVPTYLLESAVFDAPGVYHGPAGESLPPERFAVFQRAALDWLAGPDAPPVDLLHLHDHHTGLVPALLAHDLEAIALREMPTVFTVHSADHQGVAPWSVWEGLRVSVPDAETLMVEDELNALKAGVTWATAVTTVSPGYADELATDPAVSRGLIETFRRARPRLTGILNGIDAALWDPATDPHLPATFSSGDLAGKAVTKAAVCADLGLDPARPLLAYVGRLMPEKGVELLTEGVERTVRQTEASVALLGAGDPEHETAVRGLAGMLAHDGFDGRFAATIGFDEGLAHRLYAAADVFLMPSRSEPCGLAQLYAMRYGAPPVVHAVGGLRDTVVAFDGAAGTGFRFEGFTAAAFFEAIRAALTAFGDADAWARLVQNGMAADWSWHGPAGEYAALYERVCAGV